MASRELMSSNQATLFIGASGKTLRRVFHLAAREGLYIIALVRSKRAFERKLAELGTHIPANYSRVAVVEGLSTGEGTGEFTTRDVQAAMRHPGLDDKVVRSIVVGVKALNRPLNGPDFLQDGVLVTLLKRIKSALEIGLYAGEQEPNLIVITMPNLGEPINSTRLQAQYTRLVNYSSDDQYSAELHLRDWTHPNRLFNENGGAPATMFPFNGYIGVRPGLLADRPALGLDSLKTRSEDELLPLEIFRANTCGIPTSARTGHYINRDDLADFIYHRLIRAPDQDVFLFRTIRVTN